MRKVFNIWRLDTDGRIMPANNPLASSPDYYTHAQLRYDTFLSPNVIQGTFVTGVNSSVAVEIPENKLQWSFKLFVSRDGTTYTEDKTFGGADGIDYTADAFIDAEDFDTGDYIKVTGSAGSKVFEGVQNFFPQVLFVNVSQSGTSAPVVNNIGGGVSGVTGLVHTRLATGAYALKFNNPNGIFTNGFAYVQSEILNGVTGNVDGFLVGQSVILPLGNTVASFPIETYNLAGSHADSLLEFANLRIIIPPS